MDTEKFTSEGVEESDTSKALRQLRTTLENDAAYAWSWQCNLAMANFDAMSGTEGITVESTDALHLASNRAAASFMRNLFNIDMTQHPNFQSFIK